MKYIIKFFLFCMIIFFSPTQAFAFSETQLKAVFLEKFTHLIQWPKHEQKNFTICVLEDEKFTTALNEIYTGKKFKKHSVKIIPIKDKSPIPNCQLLYLGKKSQNSSKILSALKGKAVLTVSDNNKGIPKNIMLVMFIHNKKFKYIINNKLAKASNIQISHLLLRSAQEVIK